jgi:GT2 family glycosyltransferase
MNSRQDYRTVDISFLVLTWNSRRYLEECLGSIARSVSAGCSYEILVLDNGSSDGTAELLARLAQQDSARVSAFYEPVNTGTTRSRNKLCDAARGELLCFLDSDVVLEGGVVEQLVSVLEEQPSVGIVAPRIVYPSGLWQKSFDQFPTLIDKFHRFLRLRQIEEKERRQELATAVDVDYAISAFWLMRRSLFDAVGPLDEKIFYAPEDVDFCLRVWKAGYSVRYVPSVSVTHHTQEISRGFRLNRAKWEHVKGLLYYFRKHRYLLRRPSIPARVSADADERPRSVHPGARV